MNLFPDIDQICPIEDGFYLNAFSGKLVRARSLSQHRNGAHIDGILKIWSGFYEVENGISSFCFKPAQVLATVENGDQISIIIK